MVIGIGWKVEYQGKVYTTLGYAESKDDEGSRLIELAWNDFEASPTGYLAVPRRDLKVLDYNFKDLKIPGIYMEADIDQQHS